MSQFDVHDDSTWPGVTMADAVFATRHKRILVAEDDAAMRSLIAARLRKAGCQVVEARDGLEALERMGDALLAGPKARFDLVVSDVRMPGHSGLDLMACFRGADCSASVILITAFGSPEVHRSAERCGARAVFDKPFDVDDLLTAVLELG
jgi:CheY-like chemotaxis protein